MQTTKNNGISVFGSALVWFGAAVSIAEIEAGTALAPAAAGGRLPAVVAAILLGHLLGGALLFLAAYLGARRRLSAMDCAKTVFGRFGGGFFAALNLLQLVGWTAVMVAQGASAAGGLLPASVPFPALCAAIGVLVALWIYIGLRGVGRVNTVAMALLFLLTLYLSVHFLEPLDCTCFAPDPMPGPVFWFAFEMSVAMPLSWLPLAADYTRDARRPLAASLAAAAVYTLVSCWMYLIGFLAAAYGAFSAAFSALGPAALSLAALLVVVLSTVTTTFLDAYSAGESARSLCPRVPPKPFGVAVVALGTLLAVLGLMDRYLDFLYLIASVFAPMAAALLVAGFSPRPPSPVRAFLAWLAGFALYHFCLGPDSLLLAPLHPTWTSPVGATLPALLLSALFALPAPPLPTRNSTCPPNCL